MCSFEKIYPETKTNLPLFFESIIWESISLQAYLPSYIVLAVLTLELSFHQSKINDIANKIIPKIAAANES